MSTSPNRPSPAAWLLIQPIRFYQRFITPYTPATCRYYPTCSGYAVGALRTHGAAKGTLLTIWRLLRCNPFSSGGIDHVPLRGRWRAAGEGSGPADGGDTVAPEPPDGPGRFATDLSCPQQPASAGAPIAGRTAA